jgi:hypothetical protein
VSKRHLSIVSITENQKERFWRLVDKSSPNGCWTWKGWKNAKGYGRFQIELNSVIAHRVSFFLDTGTLNENLLVCHSCDNPSCVNPAHLFLGTAKDNAYDCIAKGRHISANPDRPAQMITHIKRSNRWQAQFFHNGTTVYVGLFRTPEEASAASKSARDLLASATPKNTQ